jgi:hypothetical protein
MTDQNFDNHRRYVKGFHFVLSALLLIGLICSIINVVRHPENHGGHVSSVLIALMYVCAMMMFWYIRQFPLRAQDRAIRGEENLRYFILTRKALDSSLTINQVIALRFAPDDEFVPLVDRAVAEKLSPDDIKKAIKSWKADHHRA